MAMSEPHLFPDSFSYSEFAQFISGFGFNVVSSETDAGSLLCSKYLRLMLLRPFFLLIVGSKSGKLFRNYFFFLNLLRNLSYSGSEDA